MIDGVSCVVDERQIGWWFGDNNNDRYRLGDVERISKEKSDYFLFHVIDILRETVNDGQLWGVTYECGRRSEGNKSRTGLSKHEQHHHGAVIWEFSASL